jgi:hypothetical protein
MLPQAVYYNYINNQTKYLIKEIIILTHSKYQDSERPNIIKLSSEREEVLLILPSVELAEIMKLCTTVLKVLASGSSRPLHLE